MRRSHRLALAVLVSLTAGGLGQARLAASRPAEPGTAMGEGPAAARDEILATLEAASEGAFGAARADEEPPRILPASASAMADGESTKDDTDAAPELGSGGRRLRIEEAIASPSGGTVRLRASGAWPDRALVLWDVQAGGARPVGVARSGPSGEAEFTDLVHLLREMTLVASYEGDAADAPRASAPFALVGRDPPTPSLLGLEPLPEGFVVRASSPVSGTVVLADADERAIGRFPLRPAPRAAAGALEIEVRPAPGETDFLLSLELPDGRRSAWQPFEAPEPHDEDDLVDTPEEKDDAEED